MTSCIEQYKLAAMVKKEQKLRFDWLRALGWSLMVWIILGIGVVLSVTGAMVGARMGRRRILQE